MITQHCKLNLVPSNVKPIVAVSQYDTARLIVFHIYDGDEEYTPTGNAKVLIGTQQFDAAVSGSTVSFVLDDSLTQEETSKYGEVVFYGDGKVSTCNFVFRVYYTPLQEDLYARPILNLSPLNVSQTASKPLIAEEETEEEIIEKIDELEKLIEKEKENEIIEQSV